MVRIADTNQSSLTAFKIFSEELHFQFGFDTAETSDNFADLSERSLLNVVSQKYSSASDMVLDPDCRWCFGLGLSTCRTTETSSKGIMYMSIVKHEPQFGSIWTAFLTSAQKLFKTF